MVSVRRFVIQPLRRPPLRRPPLPARSRALPSAESGKARRLLCRAGDSTRSSPNPRHGARRLPGFRSGPRPAVPPASGGFAADGSAGSGVFQQGERGYPAPSRDPAAPPGYRFVPALRRPPRTRRPFAFPETSAQTAPVSGNAVGGLGGLRRACTPLGGSAGIGVFQQGERGYPAPSRDPAAPPGYRFVPALRRPPRTRRPFAFPETSAQTAPVSGNAVGGLGGLRRACTPLGGSAGIGVFQQGERGYPAPSRDPPAPPSAATPPSALGTVTGVPLRGIRESSPLALPCRRFDSFLAESPARRAAASRIPFRSAPGRAYRFGRLRCGRLRW